MTDEEKPELQPAETNPWYVLMTVAGEQTGTTIFDIDRDLRELNRRYWNGWAAQALDKDAQAKLIADGRATEESFEPGGEFAPLTDEERAAIETALAERAPDAETPKPETRPDLSRTVFRAIFCADGFLFPHGANFSGTTFSGPADFGSATFSDFADFPGATFSDEAFFWSATFSDDADFHSATFSSYTYFKSATFSGYTFFLSATFSDDAFFESATFSGPTFFESATFAFDARFEGAMFSDRADLRSATFSEAADFSDATFKAATSFAPMRSRGDKPKGPPVRFARPPRFFGATLHEDTDWTDVVWPDPPGNRDDAIQFRRAYERLKLVMDDQKKVADEHFFLRKELECREIEEPGTLRTFASRIFRLLSDYGWSVERPILALALVWAFGAELIHIFEEYEHTADPTVDRLGFGQAMGLSFSNLFAFLGLGFHIMRHELTSLTTFSEIVAGLQMVAGPILLFLLAVGLRNQFRIK